ncbi:MAG: hypothetical protein JRM94_04770 [Nitrososphaerota archaeon]|nr:hypothetical protein [Nitrososphaerota archaeon]
MNELEFARFRRSGRLMDLHAFLNQLPKGGILHVHLTGAIPVDTILEHPNWFYVKMNTAKRTDERVPRFSIITSREWSKMKFGTSNRKRGEPFRLYRSMTSLTSEELQELREALVFRALVPEPGEGVPLLPFYNPNPITLPTEFERKFTRLDGIARDPKMMRFFLWKVLESLWMQNIDYAELMVNPFDRVTPSSIEFVFGRDTEPSRELRKALKYGTEAFEFEAAVYILRQYINQVHAFNAHISRVHEQAGRFSVWENHPKKLEVRFLIGLKRGSVARRSRLQRAFELVNQFQRPSGKRYRDMVVGINLIGDEFGVVGRPTDYLEWMIPLLRDYPGVHVSLHAGESAVKDGHVLDSILLGAERIGHGLSLGQSPHTRRIAKERGVCIETCLLSNKILGFVPDVESHPAREWIKEGMRICLNTDDPGIFDITMTDEFYYATVAFDLSLSGIKALALESLKSSFASETDKKRMIRNFAKRFDSFVKQYSIPLRASDLG